MLREENFSSRAKVDRYGRKLPKDAGRKELERFYRIADEDEQSVDDELDEDDEVQRELGRVKAADEDSSSSDDETSSEVDDVDEEDEEVFGLLDEQQGEDGIPKGEVSSRLAVVNLDWDNIRAADLMAVFSSFIPSSGGILKISIYPSEFGRERMEREETEGPPKEIFGPTRTNGKQEDRSFGFEEEGSEDDGDDVDDEAIKKSIIKEDQGLDFNSAKLRRYQLERLRYYYAVLTCSSISTAQAIYDAVDGTEYLTTANFFDLRYIPDGVDFSNDKPREECVRIPDGYRPNEFVTDALQHSKVKLTWDADDGTRKEAQKRAFAGSRADIDGNDLKAYLGSDSSEDESAEPIVVDATSDLIGLPDNKGGNLEQEQGGKLSKKDAERQRMRALLGLHAEPAEKKSRLEKTKPVGDMQITFSSGLSSEPNKGFVFENDPARDETTVEKYVRKEKERKARRKEKMKGNANPTDPTIDQAEKPKAAGSQQAAEDPAPKDLGFSDPFFTGPSHDRATTTAQRRAEKREKREQRAAEDAATAAKRAELELLMVDDEANTRGMNHFDINAIAKAEKTLSKKKKSKKRLGEREREALAMKERDAFKMDVGDERFRDVFQRSDFTIDPSHPRFKGTEGMKQLLEEGRRKRDQVGGGSGEDDGMGRQSKKLKKDEDREDQVQRLVKKIKGKTRAPT